MTTEDAARVALAYFNAVAKTAVAGHVAPCTDRKGLAHVTADLDNLDDLADAAERAVREVPNVGPALVHYFTTYHGKTAQDFDNAISACKRILDPESTATLQEWLGVQAGILS